MDLLVPKILSPNPKPAILSQRLMSLRLRNPQWLLFLFPLIVLFFSSCENKNIISEDTFIKIYADLLIAQDTSFIDSNEIDTTFWQADSFKQMIFSKHNITIMQYEETLKYYNQNPELWEKFFEKAIAYVENQKKKSHSPSQLKKKGS